MSFLSGLSNIFHGIGHIFDNQDDDQQKKQQQQQQQAQQRNSAPQKSAPQQVFQPTQNQDAPQKVVNTGSNLYQGGGPQVGSYDPNAPMIKAANDKAAADAAYAQAHPQPHQSILHNIVHGALTGAENVGGAVAGTSLGVLRAGEGLVQGATDLPNMAVHALTYVPRKIAGDNSTVNDVLSHINHASQTATDVIDKPQKWLGEKTDEAAAAYGPASEAFYKPAQVAANVATIVPAGAALLTKVGQVGQLGKLDSVANAAADVNNFVKGQKAASPVFQALEKAKGAATDAIKQPWETGTDTAAPAKASIEPGIKSANPNQEADAAAQVQAAAPPPPEPLPEITPNALNEHETAALDQLNKDAKTQVLTPEQQTTRTALQAKSDAIDAANNPQPVTPGTDVQSTANPQAGAEPTPAAPVTEPATPAATPVTPTGAEPTQAIPRSGEQLQTAPDTRTAVINHLTDAAKAISGKGKMRDAVHLDDLRNEAASNIAGLGDNQLLDAFSSNQLDKLPFDIKGIATARAAVDRLAKMDPNNPDVAAAIQNALDAIAERSSGSGLIQRFVQEDFDKLPIPMKTRYIINNIDKANKDVEGYKPLGEDPEKAKAVTDAINKYLTTGQEFSDRLAVLKGDLAKISDDPAAANAAGLDPAQLAAEVKTEELALAKNNGQLVDFYNKQVPKGDIAGRINNFARNMMLGSVSGRLNDIATTAANITHLGVESIPQGLLAKAVNFVRPGTATDTLRGTKQFFAGTKGGGKQGFSELGGTNYAGDLQKALKSDVTARAGVHKATNPITKFIQNATEFATNASKGVYDQKIYQLAVKEGQKAGYSGGELKTYAISRAANPTHEMADRAAQAWKQVNNLNDNPLSKKLDGIAQAIDTKGRDTTTLGGKTGTLLAGAVKNQVLPFTSWLGGNIWNTLTDKNFIAQGLKVVNSLRKGDVDGVIEHLAKGATQAGETYGMGYWLTQHGYIVNNNPEGYNDDGAMLHVDGRYIPVSFLGFFAPSIIMGNAAYQGINDPNNKGDAGKKMVETANTSLDNWLRSVGALGALGADNPLTKTLTAALGKNSKVTPGDVGITAISNSLNQFAPGILGDINSFLNNSGANPTHEMADTTVKNVNPDGTPGSKNYLKSAVASTLNKIPGVSQNLPRKTGVQAPDFIDRIDKGTHDNGESVKKLSDAEAATKLADDFKAKDIPLYGSKFPSGDNFDNAVEARVEKGQYDKAIAAYNQELTARSKSPDTTQKTIQGVKDKIAQMTVLKNGKYDPSIRDLYKGTTLSEWRNMGDPTSDTYDQKTYDLLSNYDGDLAKAGISGSTLAKTDPKYSAKKPSAASGRAAANKAARAAAALVKSNVLGSVHQMSATNFTGLSPQKISTAPLPAIQAVKAGDLIKQRAISVSKVR